MCSRSCLLPLACYLDLFYCGTRAAKAKFPICAPNNLLHRARFRNSANYRIPLIKYATITPITANGAMSSCAEAQNRKRMSSCKNSPEHANFLKLLSRTADTMNIKHDTIKRSQRIARRGDFQISTKSYPRRYGGGVDILHSLSVHCILCLLRTKILSKSFQLRLRFLCESGCICRAQKACRDVAL